MEEYKVRLGRTLTLGPFEIIRGGTKRDHDEHLKKVRAEELKMLNDIDDWCNENSIECVWEDGYRDGIVFTFVNEADAMAFKLRWL